MIKGKGLVIAGWLDQNFIFITREHKNVSAYSGYCESRYSMNGWGQGQKAERLAKCPLVSKTVLTGKGGGTAGLHSQHFQTESAVWYMDGGTKLGLFSFWYLQPVVRQGEMEIQTREFPEVFVPCGFGRV